jgi:hypothetical protein
MSKATTQYEVSGTRAELGAIGAPDNFSEVIEAESAKQAYLTVLNKPGFERVHVVAIKIECPTCAGFHLTIPTEYYLGV